MKTETIVWTIILILGAALLIINTTRGAGTAYVKVVDKQFVNVGDVDEPDWIEFNDDEILDQEVREQPFESIPSDKRIAWKYYEKADYADYARAELADPNQTTYRLSMIRTIGVWIAAFFTLFIFSFLYADNPFYKIAESTVVGVSAAYWMVVAFWSVLVPNLIGKLSPDFVRTWAQPGLDAKAPEWIYLVPLAFGVMLLWRLAPKGAWISRWPLAFIIGTTAGIRLVGFIQADFLSQIRNTIASLYVPVTTMVQNSATGEMTEQISAYSSFWASLLSFILVVGVLSCLVYFFFSFEHTGFVGRTAKLGIWFLMITFGAAFGYTVMGRIALLAIRIEFLLDDWLWLIDPTEQRLVEPEQVAALFRPTLHALGLA